MNKNQRQSLADKRSRLQKKIQVQKYVRQGIEFHWLEYYNTIKKLGLSCHIEFLCTCTADEQPYFEEAISDLNHPDLKPGMLQITNESLVDRIFKKYPSTSPFKYVMDLPVLSETETDVSKMLKEAQHRLGFKDDQIYFFSSDCSPLILLQWNQLVEQANRIFDDSNISLIFTDPGTNWIVFRSIEEEWRFGFTNGKN